MSGVGHGAGYHGLTGGLIMMQTLTRMINYDGGGDEKGGLWSLYMSGVEHGAGYHGLTGGYHRR